MYPPVREFYVIVHLELTHPPIHALSPTHRDVRRTNQSFSEHMFKYQSPIPFQKHISSMKNIQGSNSVEYIFEKLNPKINYLQKLSYFLSNKLCLEVILTTETTHTVLNFNSYFEFFYLIQSNRIFITKILTKLLLHPSHLFIYSFLFETSHLVVFILKIIKF